MPRPIAQSGRRFTAVAALGAFAGSLCAGAVLVAGAPAANASEVATPSSSGSFAVHGRGNGHGHGMSQYGAQGAAIAGLSTAQILAFYYPGTSLTTLSASTIRVRLSSATSNTTVFAGTPGLSVTGYGAVPSSGIQYLSLAPHGSGLGLYAKNATTAKWRALSTTLPSAASFSSSAGYVQVLLSDGSSTRYRGSVSAVRSGSGELTVNRVSLDGYTEGVVPREMPASWRSAAVGAQAVAARTYGRNAVEDGGGSYDICDTTSCQVYGGMTHYSAGGYLSWTDDPAAIAGNENKVLTYRGRTIFAQFSASNGGATVDGGQPYLVGKSDPYDDSASGDPYLDWSGATSASSLAGYYGLKKVSSIEITRRDGNGPWGGRVLSANVHGTNWSGSPANVSTTGYSLQSAMNLMTSYFRFDNTEPLPSAPGAVTATVDNASALVHWTPPPNAAAAKITGYAIYWGANRSITVGASARSAFVSPLYLTTSQRIWVGAVNARGVGPTVAVRVHGSPSLHGIVSLPRARLFDTRALHRKVTAAHPFYFDVAGQGSVPATGLLSVQLSVSVLDATASGQLAVFTSGSPAQPAAVLQYHAGQPTTASVSVQMQPSTVVRFQPSAGTVAVLADQQSYSTWRTPRIQAVTPTLLASVWHLAADTAHTYSAAYGASTVSFAGAPGVTSSTRAVLISIEGWTHSAAAVLRVWPDGLARPWVADASVGSGPNVNTVLVPLPRSQRLRLSSTAADTGARVTLLGVVGSGGLLETYPTDWIASPTAGTRVSQQQIAGIGQVPAQGVRAVLMHLTVTSPGRSGRLYAWAAGTPRPSAAAVYFGSAGRQTASALVLVGAGSKMDLQSTVAGVHVSIWSYGYLTVH